MSVVQTALTARWQQLHDAETDARPRLRLLDSDLTQLLRTAELMFEPSHTGHARPARLLSDGQRSLLHLALTAAALDIENEVAIGRHASTFDVGSARLPSLTLLAVEEPENSLSPFFLSRIVGQLQQLCAGNRAQAIISSHSASVMPRIAPESVRYFRFAPDDGTAFVRPISLPADNTEAGKYVREAVRAHPELYFAKFVILGEGDTEQLVIPRIAQAQGITLDPSFIAMVPLGGRHTNHFWRLLSDLEIPYATLLDLDYGRAGGGPGRLRDACKRLAEAGVDVFAGLDGFGTVDELTDELTTDQMTNVMASLRQFGVFFTAPLDLDYTMLRTYSNAYTALDKGERGPRNSDPTDAVLGAAHTPKLYWTPEDPAKRDERLEELQWYRYLFLSRSKPSTHLRALSRLTDDQLKEGPLVINALIKFIRARLGI
ncbi:AAA family ATPase [Kibdelosporangium persicum]